MKSKLVGYDRRQARLVYSHELACATYHSKNSSLGIPEPVELDPLCGVSGLAVSLRALGREASKPKLMQLVKHTGEGSSFDDLLKACSSLGLHGKVVFAQNRAGFIAVPKPLIAHVEHDHFITVTSANKSGVTYWCSDCGYWPGGKIHLDWKQWEAMEADQLLAIAPQGSAAAIALDYVAAVGSGKAPMLDLASQGRPAETILQAQRILSTLAGVRQVTTFGQPPNIKPPSICGLRGVSWECLVLGQNCPCVAPSCPCHAFDPINMATGEEEFSLTDLTMYNPNGPSITWGRSYHSLGNPMPTGFGSGWSHPYNYRIMYNTAGLPILYMPNGALLTLGTASNQSSPPTQANPVELTPYSNSVAGLPLMVQWKNPNSTFNPSACTFTLQFDDKSLMLFTPITVAGSTDWVPTKITSVAGTSLNLNWAPLTVGTFDNLEGSAGSYYSPQLQSISDISGNIQLIIQYTQSATYVGGVATNYISAVYEQINPSGVGRAILYGTHAYPSLGVPINFPQFCAELITVSQLVSVTNALSANPSFGTPNGYQQIYNYSYNIRNGDATGETIAYLTSIQVPAPSSANYPVAPATSQWSGGYSTATINYDLSSGAVSSLVDNEGNALTATAYGTTTVQYSRADLYDHTGALMGRQYFGWDANMSLTFKNVVTMYILSNGSYQDLHAITPTTYTYNTPNAPLKPDTRVDANGRKWSYTYDNFGHVTTVTTPKSEVITNHYDTTNYVLGELMWTQPAGHQATTFTYNWTVNPNLMNNVSGNGLLRSVATPVPYNYYSTNSTPTTTASYDALGNCVEIDKPGNSSTPVRTVTFHYTSASHPTECLGEPVSVVDESGNTTNFAYGDGQGNVTSTTDAVGNTFYSSYNRANQLVTTTATTTGQPGPYGVSQKNIYLYEGGSLLERAYYGESGAMYKLWSYIYGSEGELQQKGEGANYTYYVYDGAYRIATRGVEGYNNQNTFIQTPLTVYGYDGAGRLSSTTYPLTPSQVESYTYDSSGSYTSYGDLVQKEDGRNVITSYFYSNDTPHGYAGGDLDGKLSKVTFAPQVGSNPYSGQGQTYSYDSLDRLLTASDAVGSSQPGLTSYTYDDLNEVESMTRQFAGVSMPPQTLTYSYNDDGSRYALNTPPATIWYGYYANGLLSAVTCGSQTANYTYYANNLLHQKTLPNQVTTTFSYNTDDALTAQTTTGCVFSGTPASITYGPGTANEFNGDLSLNQWNTTTSPSTVPVFTGATTYTYDSQERLTNEQSYRNGGYNSSFAYDVYTSPTQALAGNPTTIRGNSNQAYNNNNQITTGSGNTSFTYDGEGNPTTYLGTTLVYDALNRVTTNGSTSDSYGSDGLRASYTSGGATTYFLNDGTMPVVELNSSGSATALNLFGADGIISRENASGALSEYVFDLLGNTAVRTDKYGNAQAEFDYDAYGLYSAKPGSTPDPWMYQAQSGYYFDTTTTCYLCGHRFYDTSLCRWLNRDPIGPAGGVNLYAYCGGNPVGTSDPSGLQNRDEDDPTESGARGEGDLGEPTLQSEIAQYKRIMAHTSQAQAARADGIITQMQYAEHHVLSMQDKNLIYQSCSSVGKSQLATNVENGAAFERQVLEAFGPNARMGKGGWKTAQGMRFPDIYLYDNPEHTGAPILFIECKFGDSPYHPGQVTKDWLLYQEFGVPTIVVRG